MQTFEGFGFLIKADFSFHLTVEISGNRVLADDIIFCFLNWYIQTLHLPKSASFPFQARHSPSLHISHVRFTLSDNAFHIMTSYIYTLAQSGLTFYTFTGFVVFKWTSFRSLRIQILVSQKALCQTSITILPQQDTSVNFYYLKCKNSSNTDNATVNHLLIVL